MREPAFFAGTFFFSLLLGLHLSYSFFLAWYRDLRRVATEVPEVLSVSLQARAFRATFFFKKLTRGWIPGGMVLKRDASGKSPGKLPR